jgi:Sulfotransferase family
VYAFLIGTGRCGSTLVHQLIARHPGVGFVSKVEDRLPWLPPAAGRLNNPLYRRAPSPRLAPSEAYRALARQVSPIVVSPVRDLVAADAMPWLARRFQAFFGQRAAVQGRPVFLHKFTGWPRTGFISAVLGEARFVNVVRDGRAFAASTLRMPWERAYLGPARWRWGPLPDPDQAEWEASGRSFALLAGLGWKVMMDAYADARTLVPEDRWLDVRYEDLLADPIGRCKETLEFLGLEWDRRFEAALPVRTLSDAPVRAWREDLDAASIALLDASLAGHLDRWGYR